MTSRELAKLLVRHADDPMNIMEELHKIEPESGAVFFYELIKKMPGTVLLKHSVPVRYLAPNAIKRWLLANCNLDVAEEALYRSTKIKDKQEYLLHGLHPPAEDEQWVVQSLFW